MIRPYNEEEINFYPLNEKSILSGRNDKSILKPTGNTIGGERVDIEKEYLKIRKRMRNFKH